MLKNFAANTNFTEISLTWCFFDNSDDTSGHFKVWLAQLKFDDTAFDFTVISSELVDFAICNLQSKLLSLPSQRSFWQRHGQIRLITNISIWSLLFKKAADKARVKGFEIQLLVSFSFPCFRYGLQFWWKWHKHWRTWMGMLFECHVYWRPLSIAMLGQHAGWRITKANLE